MQVRVLFFGMLKDVAGLERDNVELPAGSHISDLLEQYVKVSPKLQPYYDVIAVALNQEYSDIGATLRDGDEIALIPPVSGGNLSEADGLESQVRIVRERIDCQQIMAAVRHPEDGAVATFEGIVRNHSRGRRTIYLEYEAYELMALKEMERLKAEAVSKFAIREAVIVHRLGRLEIGETSVLIVVASAHRAAAFDACRWLIDTLKKTVPIWKKEHFEDGAVWADGEPFPGTRITGVVSK